MTGEVFLIKEALSLLYNPFETHKKDFALLESSGLLDLKKLLKD